MSGANVGTYKLTTKGRPKVIILFKNYLADSSSSAILTSSDAYIITSLEDQLFLGMYNSIGASSFTGYPITEITDSYFVVRGGTSGYFSCIAFWLY